MDIFKKLTDKNTWVYWVIVILSLMLFEGTVSRFISGKITFLPPIILSFISLLIVFIFSDLILAEVLEI